MRTRHRPSRKKTAEAIRQKIAREVDQLLPIIFQERRKTGRLDLEATEMALRSALHRAGAAALTELLQFPTTIHMVPVPRLVLPTPQPLFSAEQNAIQKRFAPVQLCRSFNSARNARHIVSRPLGLPESFSRRPQVEGDENSLGKF